jgi:hypothetical protein
MSGDLHLAAALARVAAKHRQAAAEVKARDDTMSDALAQPHRRGDSDPRLEDPLWGVCQRLRLSGRLFRAGRQYARISRANKLAIDAYGSYRAQPHARPQSPWEIESDRRDRAKYDAAVDALRAVDPNCHRVIERACHDGSAPFNGEEDGLLRRGLDALANHFWPHDPH